MANTNNALSKGSLKDPIAVCTRYDSALWDQLKDSAKRSFRSVNSEVNHRLKVSFEREAGEAAA
jgi:hypothetical protein